MPPSSECVRGAGRCRRDRERVANGAPGTSLAAAALCRRERPNPDRWLSPASLFASVETRWGARTDVGHGTLSRAVKYGATRWPSATCELAKSAHGSLKTFIARNTDNDDVLRAQTMGMRAARRPSHMQRQEVATTARSEAVDGDARHASCTRTSALGSDSPPWALQGPTTCCTMRLAIQ